MGLLILSYYKCMNKISEQNPSLLQDKPIRSISDDRYNRGEYVRNLALGLCRFTGQGSLVVGIQGPWGSGKTSLKNMLVEQIAAISSDGEDNEKVRVVEFDPWLYSGSGHLVSLLFRQISRAFSKRLDVLKYYGAKTLKFLGIAASFTPDNFSLSGAAIAKAFKSIEKAVDPDNQDIKQLSKRRQKLKKKLNKAKIRIIVFIDDLDRLMDDEVTDVMRAVKAVGDLPYMTYVLLYDRDFVTKSLNERCHGKGDEYLEKIIQVPIGMPELPQEVVYEQLKDELTGIVGEKNLVQIYDKAQNAQSNNNPLSIYDFCVKPFVRTMRDVDRLMNDFKLRYEVLKDDAEPGDLLGITSLEVFNPNLHRWIMAGKDYLCDSDLPADDVKNYLTSIPSSGSQAENRDLQAVQALFPFVAYCMGNLHTRPEEVGRTIHRPERFNTYFRLSIGNGLIREAEYKKLLVDEPLGAGNSDDSHWLIISSEGFADEPTKYLDEMDSGRCAEVVSYCLRLEASHRSVYSSCISHDVATAIITNDYDGERFRAVIQTIVDSRSPVSMIVAACMVYEVSHAIQRVKSADEDEQEQAKAKFTSDLMIHVAMFNSLPFCQNSEDIEQSGLGKYLASLREKLKQTNCEQPQTPLSGWLLQWYASVIPVIFNEPDDKYKALRAFQDLVDETKFVDYALNALIQDEKDDCIVDVPLLRRFITHEEIQTSLKLWRSGQQSTNIKHLAAYVAEYKSEDQEQLVTSRQLHFILETWKQQREQEGDFILPEF